MSRFPALVSGFLLLVPLGNLGTAHAMSPATKATIDDGLRLLYNLDYADARARVRQLVAEEPKNPYGNLFEASIIWWQADNEYGLFKDTPTLENLFEADINEGLAKGNEALRTLTDDHQLADVHFAMGMALGVKGQWNLLRHRWIKAYFEGRKAVKHLRKCLDLDPDFYDANLGLGIYDYQAAKLPGVLKISALLLVHGNAKRGLEEMRLAMDHGHYVSSQAGEFLSSIYRINEHDPAKALPLIRMLRNRFPDSPYFQFLEAVTLYQLHDLDGSVKTALPLFDRTAKDPPIIHRKLLSLLCGLAEDNKCLDTDSVLTGIEWLTNALQNEPSRPTQRTALLHFYRGLAYDISGDRPRAEEDYRTCLKSPKISDIQEVTRHCLVSPCSRTEVMAQLKSMSLENASAGEMLSVPRSSSSKPIDEDGDESAN